MHTTNELRFNRRSAALGVGAALVVPNIAGAMGMQGSNDEEDAGATPADPGSSSDDDVQPVLSSNPMWETFGVRTLGYASYDGADTGEVFSTMRRIGDDGTIDDWHREWMATAHRIAEIGDSSAKLGHEVSAREAYLRASNYYHASYFPLFGLQDDERLYEAFDLETKTFLQASELMEYPVEPVEIPYEGTTLPGYMITVDDSGDPRPTIIHTNGYDSTIQEMFFAHAPAAIRRGYNVLLFDGPGQGRNLFRDGMPMRPDWENVVSPAVDYALSRSEIDPDRLVLAGWSFGGFLAPRAAGGGEERIAALIADPGFWDQRFTVMASLPLDDDAIEQFPDIDPALLDPMEEWLASPDADPEVLWQMNRGKWVHNVDSVYDYFVELLRYEVSPIAGNITCPTFISTAENDPVAQAAPVLYEHIGSETKELVTFTEAEGAGGHCQALARKLYHQRVFDWLDGVLGA